MCDRSPALLSRQYVRRRKAMLRLWRLRRLRRGTFVGVRWW